MAITMTSGGVSKTFRYYPQDAFYVDSSGTISTDSSAGRQVREAWFQGAKYYPDHMPPDRIVITTPPTKLSYGIGEAIDYSGMIVTAYSPDGSPYDTPRYPHGVIPIGELALRATADADGQIAVGRDVPSNLRTYLGTAPVLATVLDVDYPQAYASREYFGSRTTYHVKAHGNGAKAGVALVEQTDQYTDNYGRRRACVQGGFILVSDEPFSFSYEQGTTTYRNGYLYPRKTMGQEETYHSDLIGQDSAKFGFSFVYDTYNNKTIYVAAPYYSFHPGDGMRFVENPVGNIGATALDSGGAGNPDGFSVKTPHNIVSRFVLADRYTTVSPNNYMIYQKYGRYTVGNVGNYSDMQSTFPYHPYTSELYLNKIIADIAVYLLYGNVTMTATETTLPVSWISPNGDTLTTWLTVNLTRHR